ncbi:MAG: glycosyltransferase family 4 protein [Planctomycetaceae bacterium]|jgi:glycosyltransferase involved in cell wall biosynthesis|nr:glycosyltransferase family 4 protein [Phycisphaerales bacterium]MCE2653079.1 glycosyltransferase family 4 protein [Planctomycetaceae bacterium]
MRLLILSTIEGVSWGGCEEIGGAIGAAAVGRGHEVALSMYPFRPRPAKVESLVQSGVRLIERPFRPYGRLNKLRHRLRRPLRALADWRPDVVVINEATFLDGVASTEGEAIGGWLNRASCPYIVLVHANSTAAIANEAVRSRASAYYQRAAIVGVLGRGAGDALRRQLGRPLDNLTIFRNPLPASLGSVPPPVQRQPHEPLRLAMVGRLDPVKAPDLAFEALADPELRQRPWTLTCYGGGDEACFRAVAAHFGIADRVRFAGHVRDVAAVWHHNDVLLMPSRTEGLPLSMIECMSAGRVPVATDVGVIDEWVTDGVTGFLAEAPRKRYLVQALLRLWSRLPDLPLIGRAAQQTVAEHARHGLDAQGLVDALTQLAAPMSQGSR